MTDLLTSLGTKIADRWLAGLLLPGLLFTAACVCGYFLGWRHALDPGWLTDCLAHAGGTLSGKPSAILVTVILALLGATAAAIAARGLGSAVHRGYLARGPLWWVLRRRRRARAAAAHRRPLPPVRYLPRHATPIGDRFRLIGERVDAQYGLDATLVWPRLWLLLTDTDRTAVQTGYGQYQDATTLAGWSLLYLGLGALWPPALLAAVVGGTIGYRRARSAGAVVADLVESSIDVHQSAIAAIAGIALPDGRITHALGLRINDLLNKRA